MKIQFTKMHGLGNDFVMIDNLNGDITLTQKQVRFLCDRHFGVGADGVILMEMRDGVDCFMNYYNADGSLSEMCGNGIRCTPKFFKYITGSEKTTILVGTRGGVKTITCNDDGTFSATMGKAVFTHDDFPTQLTTLYDLPLEFVSVGNPHAITFVNNLVEYDIHSLGPKIEYDVHFRNRINLELAQVINTKKIKLDVWERGCGVTLACGTAAAAVYALALKKGFVDGVTEMELPGGILVFSQDKDGEISQRGPAEIVFKGEVDIPNF